MRRVHPFSWSSGPSVMMGYFTFGEAISFLGKSSNLVEKLHLIGQILLRTNMQSLLNGLNAQWAQWTLGARRLYADTRARVVCGVLGRTERRSGVHFYLG